MNDMPDTPDANDANAIPAPGATAPARRRTRKPAEGVVPAVDTAAAVDAAPAAAAPRRRTARNAIAEAAAAAADSLAMPVTPASEGAVEPLPVPDAVPAPAARKRAARRPAVEAAAEPVAVETVAASTEAAPAVPTSAEPALLAASADGSEAEVPVARKPRTRKPRAEAVTDDAANGVVDAASVPAQPAAAAEPMSTVAVTAEAAPGDAPAAAAADAEAAGDGDAATDGAPREGRRRDRRQKREAREAREAAERAQAGGGDAGAPAGVFTLGDASEGAAAGGPLPPVVDAQALFADVLSGQYDADAPVEDELIADPGKRVLRPEPEAPKLHKVLAQAGVGSRRDMEQLIQEGQVTVNGEVAHIGMRIAQGDQIKIAGRPVKVRIAPPPARVLAYHKPVGEVVTHHDPEGRPTVFRRLPRLPVGKWLSVGRLDINTEGLLLFTNSGELANQLMHPRFGVEREYAVRVLGSLDEANRAKLLDGVDIEGQKAAFKSIEDGGGEGLNRWYRVIIGEGRNREVRKLFDAVGLTVSRLIRIRYATVVLPRGLKRGVCVELEDHDVRLIRQLANGPRADRGERPERGEPQRPERGERGEAPQQPQQRGQGKGKGGGAQAQNGPNPQGGGQRGQNGQNQNQGQGKRGGKGGGNFANGGNGGPGGNGGQPGKGGPGFERRGPPDGNRPAGEWRDGPPRDNRAERPPSDDDEFGDGPLHIPNPLEQTFDRRFATGSKRISAGFGRPSDDAGRGGPAGGNRAKGSGPREPDPLQTSVGYIGADAYFNKPGGGGNKNRGGGGRRR